MEDHGNPFRINNLWNTERWTYSQDKMSHLKYHPLNIEEFISRNVEAVWTEASEDD